jgi:hypothetical protein
VQGLQWPQGRHLTSDAEGATQVTTIDGGPAWARGYDVTMLRELAQVYRTSGDDQYALGAFSRVKENALAQWLEEGELVSWGQHDVPGTPVAVAQVSHPRVQVPVRDFTGEARLRVPAGSAVVRHPAATTVAGEEFLHALVRAAWPITDGHDVYLEGWVESPLVQALAAGAGLDLLATKIKASSELVGVWGPAGTPHVEVEPADALTLGRLHVLPGRLSDAAEEVAGMAGWADHYSSYNARHSWSALSLHGYVEPGTAPDPAQIVKPAEMSKAWKAEHPGWEEWAVAPTPLLERLPAVAQALEHVQEALGIERWQRVRLMRLQPGGGELTRHSDITDPEAGTADGKLVRIHVPLITNPQVLFRMWRLSGAQVEAHMPAGTVWSLDTRKPHKAGNYGTSERVHLVADAYSNEALRSRLAEAAEAEEVPA